MSQHPGPRWGSRAWGPRPERVEWTLLRLDNRIDLAQLYAELGEARRIGVRRDRVARFAHRVGAMEE